MGETFLSISRASGEKLILMNANREGVIEESSRHGGAFFQYTFLDLFNIQCILMQIKVSFNVTTSLSIENDTCVVHVFVLHTRFNFGDLRKTKTLDQSMKLCIKIEILSIAIDIKTKRYRCARRFHTTTYELQNQRHRILRQVPRTQKSNST